ncbi:MAG: pyruvate, phosphate dikinase [Deltaproteobacteria bacterium]
MPMAEGGVELYHLGCGFADSRGATADIVGSKAANLFRLAAAGLPVPPGFVLPTGACREYLHAGRKLPDGFAERLKRHLQPVESVTGFTFGGDRRPLLVSVRSGAAVSMPGMMDTILNVGLCERTLPALLRMTGNPHHAWDSYRRLVQAYAEVVEGLSSQPFEKALTDYLQREGVPSPRELDVTALKDLTAEFLAKFEAAARKPFPQEPLVQLAGAVEAIFRSWESPRAVEYRRLHGLDHLAGTAALVQAMVFGNMGGTSGSGVAFTRDPSTGEKLLYLDFLWNAQGEDVVSGRCPVHSSAALQQAMPPLYRELLRTSRQLEQLFGDVQDFEFTVQEGRLYLLQSRDAKRTPWAALRIACDLVGEGLIDPEQALHRLAGYDLQTIQSVRLASGAELVPLCRGTPASPGAAVGEIALNPAAAVAAASAGRTPILVRSDISPDDIAGLAVSAGVLTSLGGRTSHAAVVARQLNKVCIVGCQELLIDANRRGCRLGEQWFHEGDFVSLDGSSGCVYPGKLEVVMEKPNDCLRQVESWKGAHSEGAMA